VTRVGGTDRVLCQTTGLVSGLFGKTQRGQGGLEGEEDKEATRSREDYPHLLER
jgi:hypothetical protein